MLYGYLKNRPNTLCLAFCNFHRRWDKDYEHTFPISFQLIMRNAP